MRTKPLSLSFEVGRKLIRKHLARRLHRVAIAVYDKGNTLRRFDGIFCYEVGRYAFTDEMRDEILEVGLKALSGEEIDL